MGKALIMPKNSILLEDVDVYNIPEDKDILIDKPEKNIVAIGKNIENQEENDKEQQIENHSLSKNLFEELSFEEIKKKYLFNMEGGGYMFNKKNFARFLVKYLVFFIPSYFFTYTCLEYYNCKFEINLMDEQELKSLKDVKESFVNFNLINNPVFARKKFEIWINFVNELKFLFLFHLKFVYFNLWNFLFLLILNFIKN